MVAVIVVVVAVVVVPPFIINYPKSKAKVKPG